MTEKFLIRDLDYCKTFGIYSPGSLINYEIVSSGGIKVRVSLERLIFNDVAKKIKFESLGNHATWDLSKRMYRAIKLEEDLPLGYYLLRFKGPNLNHAITVIINDKRKKVRLAIIKPVFTEWTYHSDGFYPSEEKSAFKRLLNMPKRGLKRAPLKFPAHGSINLTSFYKQNHRWDKTIWDKEFGTIDGLWCDELLCAFPIFSLLEKNNISYHVYTDVDLHAKNKELTKYNTIIFYGSEGMTKEYFDFLSKLANQHKKKIILWGCQAFGYRQLEYDTETHDLSYSCSRGKMGLWGDKLEDQEPDWGDEAKLLGFHFPEPKDADWRKPYKTLSIIDKDHGLIKGAGLKEKLFTYLIKDHDGNMREGLTWAGGEFFRKVSPDAKVVACLGTDKDVIGIGEYKNILIFSPTYLPAFFAYQNEEHPEIEKMFISAVTTFLDRK